MRYFRIYSRILTYPLLALFFFTTMPVVPAQAALIRTEDVLQQPDLSAARDKVARFLERQDVREQLAAFGVNPAEVDARIAALSDEEITRIAGKIDQMPPGQGPFGVVFTVALIILLVLLVTDILGVTNVLPFVKHWPKSEHSASASPLRCCRVAGS
jgi:uncharacterized protein DUF6627